MQHSPCSVPVSLSPEATCQHSTPTPTTRPRPTASAVPGSTSPLPASPRTDRQPPPPAEPRAGALPGAGYPPYAAGDTAGSAAGGRRVARKLTRHAQRSIIIGRTHVKLRIWWTGTERVTLTGHLGRRSAQRRRRGSPCRTQFY